MTAEVIVAGLALLVSIISLIVTGHFAAKQAALQERQLSLSKDTEALTERLSRDEATVESRRFFSILWEKYILLSKINPQSPIEPDVRRAINTFELIALCWQANVVDKEMVVLSFGADYNLICGQIEQSVEVPGTGKSGAELLNEHPSIMRVRTEINEKRQARGSMTS